MDGTMRVKINDKEGPFYLLLLLIVLLEWYILLKSNNLITGLAGNLIPNGVPILQCADDTIVCMKEHVNIARTLL